jgi:hypothetical protein
MGNFSSVILVFVMGISWDSIVTTAASTTSGAELASLKN